MIRLLTGNDVDIFRTIRLEALRTEPAAFASTVEDWENLSEEEWRRWLLGTPVFVAFEDERPAGIMGLLRQRARKMAHRATIIMVYVDARHRGTGVAKRLLAMLTEHAKAHDIRQLELSVSAENPRAIRFYRREGFTEIGRIPGGFCEDGVEVDDILMARRIAG